MIRKEEGANVNKKKDVLKYSKKYKLTKSHTDSKLIRYYFTSSSVSKY
jgi:hypothetical protein